MRAFYLLLITLLIMKYVVDTSCSGKASSSAECCSRGGKNCCFYPDGDEGHCDTGSGCCSGKYIAISSLSLILLLI